MASSRHSMKAHVRPIFPRETILTMGRRGKRGVGSEHTGTSTITSGRKGLSSNKNISLLVYILWLASLPSSPHPSSQLPMCLPYALVPASFGFWLPTCSSQGGPFHHSAEQKLLSQSPCRLRGATPRAHQSTAPVPIKLCLTVCFSSQQLHFEEKALCWARNTF